VRRLFSVRHIGFEVLNLIIEPSLAQDLAAEEREFGLEIPARERKKYKGHEI